MADEKTTVIETVKKYLASVSGSKAPFSQEHVIPEGGFAFSHPEIGIIGLRLNQLDNFWVPDTQYSIAAPGPEAWVQGGVAAVFAGFHTKEASGKEAAGTGYFGLARVEGGGWKVSSVAATQIPEGGAAPEVATSAPEGFLAPVEALQANFGSASWEALSGHFLPEAVNVEVRDGTAPHPASAEAAVGELAAAGAQFGGGLTEEYTSTEVRVVGDTGLVWAPFVDKIAGQPVFSGARVFTLTRKDGRWLISGSSNGGAKI